MLVIHKRLVYSSDPEYLTVAVTRVISDQSTESVMNLLLWRHAEAEEASTANHDAVVADLRRPLTAYGRKQAECVARWLKDRLNEDMVVLTSPAARTRQTAEALTDHYRLVDELAPGAAAAAVLAVVYSTAGWPASAGGTVVAVGHQPTLGRTASLLLSGAEADWGVQKAGLWWLTSCCGENKAKVALRAVVSPDLV